MIALVVTVFTVLGLVMVLSASSVRLFHAGQSPWRIFTRQLVWAVLGAIALWICARVPYGTWRRFVTPILLISTATMLLPFAPVIGREVNGARAWVSLGSMSIQPSEFMKVAVLLYCAALLTSRESEMHDLRRTMYPVLAIAGLGAGLCVLQSSPALRSIFGQFSMLCAGQIIADGVRDHEVAVGQSLHQRTGAESVCAVV